MKERTRIGLREVRDLAEGSTLWDSVVPGFGARRQKSPAIAYFVFYRTLDGRQRWHTIGRHGAPWTPDGARTEARDVMARVSKGEDPAGAKQAARVAANVAELCDQYLEDAEAGRLLTRRKVAKKASTLATDRGRILRHIKPVLGRLPVAAVTREDVEAFMHKVAEGGTAMKAKSGRKRGVSHVTGGKGTASRTVGLLGAIFSYAVRKRMRADNPVRGVDRFADGTRERGLSDEEYGMLGAALAHAAIEPERSTTAKAGVRQRGTIWPAAVAATRFLALTGWRSGEALGLRWAELDLPRRTAKLPDTKTGVSIRPLSIAACAVLHGLPKAGELVFPPTRGEGRMSGFPGLFARIGRLADIPPDVTPHVLRHAFASMAGDLGYSEPTIAALVGHKGHSVTSRYIHAADAVLLAAADAVADRTAELMGEAKPSGKVVKMRRA